MPRCSSCEVHVGPVIRHWDELPDAVFCVECAGCDGLEPAESAADDERCMACAYDYGPAVDLRGVLPDGTEVLIDDTAWTVELEGAGGCGWGLERWGPRGGHHTATLINPFPFWLGVLWRVGVENRPTSNLARVGLETTPWRFRTLDQPEYALRMRTNLQPQEILPLLTVLDAAGDRDRLRLAVELALNAVSEGDPVQPAAIRRTLDALLDG